jgi:HD-GYP domain-containing protein (c-di-GMP phosphodiesterase class II)
MRLISVKSLRPGMELARKVTYGDGAPLLNAGIVLQNKYIEQLKRLNISAVYIHDNLIPDVFIEDVVLEETRERAVNQVRNALTELKQTEGKVSIKKMLMVKKDLSNVVDDIVSQLLSNPNLTVNLADIRSADNYTFSHSVNVAILSTMTAISLGCKNNELKNLGLGAFLHDLGKTMIPLSILNKPGSLDEKEVEEMRQHPKYGYDLIKYKDAFSSSSLAIIYSHHERIDGSGYPKGLTGKDLDLYSKICAVTDVYDALISDRPYRSGMTSHRALEILESESAGFDLQVLQTFYRHVAAYPVGTIVGLSNGLLGVVTDNIYGYPTRPRVRVIAERESFLPVNHEEIDLIETLNIVVDKVYEDHELPKIINK